DCPTVELPGPDGSPTFYACRHPEGRSLIDVLRDKAAPYWAEVDAKEKAALEAQKQKDASIRDEARARREREEREFRGVVENIRKKTTGTPEDVFQRGNGFALIRVPGVILAGGKTTRETYLLVEAHQNGRGTMLLVRNCVGENWNDVIRSGAGIPASWAFRDGERIDFGHIPDALREHSERLHAAIRGHFRRQYAERSRSR
ncbi:MAG: hypothetical protein AAB691_01000, partial [Patescibacteria group bacterium]